MATAAKAAAGLIPDPNRDAMSDVLVKNGLTVDDMLARWTMFGTYQQMELAAEKVRAEKVRG